MLVDQIISKGVLYYVFSSALTAGVCLAVVLSVLLPQQWNISLGSQQAVTSGLVLMLVVAILLWMRDLIQQMIDRNDQDNNAPFQAVTGSNDRNCHGDKLNLLTDGLGESWASVKPLK